MVAGILWAALLLPGPIPHRAEDHCAVAGFVEAHNHRGGHGAVPNNTRNQPSDSCPHCPPARCASESSCISLISAAPIQTVQALLPLPAAVPEQNGARLLKRSTEPPTPPPQGRLRFV